MGKDLVPIEKAVASVEEKKGVVSRRNAFKKIGQASIAVASLFFFTKQEGCTYTDYADYSDHSDYGWSNYSSTEK